MRLVSDSRIKNFCPSADPANHQALYCVSHDGVDPYLQTFGAFAVQPVGMLAEHLWTKSTGKRVGGWPGWAWSLSFVAFTFSFMIDAWMERGLVNGTPPYSNFKWYRFLLRKQQRLSLTSFSYPLTFTNSVCTSLAGVDRHCAELNAERT